MIDIKFLRENPEIVKQNIKNKFQDSLLTWYSINKRDLPWRQTSNPYYIWISEIMLQQTQVQTVIPYYHRFISNFPTIESLAKASLEDLLGNSIVI